MPTEGDFEFRQESSSELTKSQINRLGDRLRKGKASDADLRLLDRYRLSFRTASDTVVATIRSQLRLEPTIRSIKTPTSIIDKLRREKTRLSQMQDIAGCRIVVTDLRMQDHIVTRLQDSFDDTDIDDRRTKPSHGYRAVHVIVAVLTKSVEVQVRTALQDWWAQLSEKYSDLIDTAIKYGRGDPAALDHWRLRLKKSQRWKTTRNYSNRFEWRLPVAAKKPKILDINC